MEYLQSGLQKFVCTDTILETSEDESPLLQCPDLIRKKILDYLQPCDLKILRLTCKTTKAWIEHPNVLKKLQIIIDGNKKRMRELLKSRVLWNNLSFKLSQNFESPKRRLHFYSSRYLFSNLVKKLGSTLKIVEVDSIVSPSYLLGRPNFLQEFAQCDVLLNIESISIDLLQFRDGCRAEFKNIQTLLHGMHLKHLKIKEIDDYEFDLEGKSTFFEDILFSCEELVELDVPCRISIPWKKGHEANERENIILPVIKYLRQGEGRKKCGLRSIKLKLSRYSKSDKSEESCSLLQELTQVCLLNGTTLHYLK